ncbi:MAG: hypothetical protein ACI8X3_002518 [Saprospiraceae bacterium]
MKVIVPNRLRLSGRDRSPAAIGGFRFGCIGVFNFLFYVFLKKVVGILWNVDGFGVYIGESIYFLSKNV